MEPEPLFQAFPDRPEYPRYTIDVVSPETPCGAGWLANCLIELGIPAWKQWNADDRSHWLDLGGDRFRYRFAGSPWSRVLPALVDGREFTFRPGRAVRVHHVWPTAYPRAERTIFFVRDPRDALYSAWHRQLNFGAIAPDTDFPTFCAGRFFHYPISWADYMLLFLRVWRRALCDFGGIIVRFEDYRRNAHETLARALEYLDIDAWHDAIARAVDASSLSRIRDAERRLLAEGVVEVPLIRGEAPGERTTGGAITTRFDDVLAWLGYPLARVSPNDKMASSSGDAAAVIDAIRKAGVPVIDDSWLVQAVRMSLERNDS